MDTVVLVGSSGIVASGSKTELGDGDAGHVPALTIRWLIRLRWCAIAAQVVTIGVAAYAMDIALPVAAMAALLAVSAASNVALAFWAGQAQRTSSRVVAGVLLMDTALLTILLGLSGGPSNPFCLLYFAYVTLGALALGGRWAAALVLASAAAYAALFLTPQSGAMHHHGHAGHSAYILHLQGMWVAFAATASLIAYFVARLAAELRRRELELGRAQRLAARAEKLGALTTLAAGAAHELGTPLGTIAIAAGELERRARSASAVDWATDAKLIRSEVERCTRIVQRMCAQAGASAGELPGPVSVAELFSLLRSRLAPSEAARLDAVPIEASFSCPREGLVQVLVNLVQNAIQASAPAERVTLSAKTDGDSIKFQVQDHGAGVAAEHLQRLGEPFFTTKPPGQGMGLGLFLAQALAARGGGTLVLTSRLGAGTSVTLELPRLGAGFSHAA